MATTEWQKARAYDAVHPLVDIPDAQKAERVDRKIAQQRRLEAGRDAHGGGRRVKTTVGAFVVPDVPWLEKRVQGGYTPPPIVDDAHGATTAPQDVDAVGGEA